MGWVVAALLAGILAAVPAEAQAPKKVVTILWGIPQIDPLASNMTVGQALGYYAEEGLDVRFQGVNGSAQVIQGVAAGHNTFGITNIEPMLEAVAKGTDPGVVWIYNMTRATNYEIGVPRESPITDARQLKGKAIGVPNMGSGAVQFARNVVQEVGLDPKNDVEILPVGFTAQAATAIRANRVQAVSIFDAGFVGIENADPSIRFRYLPNPLPYKDDLVGPALFVKRDLMRDPAVRDLAARLARGLARGTLFVITNSEAAVKAHWKLYPESVPKGKPREQALREIMRLVDVRKGKWDARTAKVKKWGAFRREEWDAMVRYQHLEGKVGDVGRFFSNEIVEEANRFDAEHVVKQARAWRED